MKNAFVLSHHFGDDGNAPEGSILCGVTQKRFDALEKAGLVREATAEEVATGYQPPFEAEAPADDADGDEKKKREPLNKKAAAPANKSAA